MSPGRQVHQPLVEAEQRAELAEQQEHHERRPPGHDEPGRDAVRGDGEPDEHPRGRDLHERTGEDLAHHRHVTGLSRVHRPGRQARADEQDGDASQRDDDVARRPARPGDRAGEEQLRAEVVLLVPQPRHGLQAVRRGDHTEKAEHRGEHRVRQHVVAAELLEHVLGLRAAQHVADAARDTADEHPVDDEPDGPAQQRTPLQPPSQPEDATQSSGSGAGPIR